ncbi:sensor histidine kinase [Peribacillus asahii]|uniref:sensor histidine kinase n=1 Tax=Peribacillus asahii TaxID=228899 RepID=UPI00207985E9|nr:sensor histidine kinase [Peribacillus asahii]USK69398.1 sensor histidine kinase [Peribacillus asahii]
MKLQRYIKERAVFLSMNIFLFVLVALFLWLINVQAVVIIIVFVCWFGPLLLSYGLEFLKRKNFYDELLQNFEALDQKYLLPEIIEEPNFLEGQILYDIIKTTDKQMHEHVKKYKDMQAEYRDYIEAWVHEVKTPIASSKLMFENHKNEVTKGIMEELEKIEGYVEQALYYARSSSASKDYIVKEFSLQACISKVLKKNAKAFIHKKIQLQLTEMDEVVYSDEKWIEFILHQIIVNSINYCDNKISLYTRKNEHSLILYIVDDGIGIDEKDIGRVFDKGFTGENGRQYRRSTGMGLYICKLLADKLHLGLTIQSTKGEGTEVQIIFPKSKVVLLES